MPITTVERLTIKPGPSTIEADVSMITRMAEVTGCTVMPGISFYSEDARLGQNDFYDMAENFGHGKRPRIAEQAWCGLVDVYINDCLTPGHDNPLDYAIAPDPEQRPDVLDYGQYDGLSVQSLFKYVTGVKEAMAYNKGELPPDLHEQLPSGFKGRVFSLWSAIARHKLYEVSRSNAK